MFLSGICLILCSRLVSGNIFWGGSHRSKVSFSSLHIKGTNYQYSSSLLILTIITQPEAVCQVSPLLSDFSQMLFAVLFGRSHFMRLRLKEWGVRLHLVLCHTNYSSAWEICVFYLCIHLFNHSLMSVWTHGYLFCLLAYNPRLLYFVAPILPALAFGRSFGWYVCFFDIRLPLRVFHEFVYLFWALPYFLAP